MRSFRSFVVFLWAVACVPTVGSQTKPAESTSNIYTIVIHGGAGNISQAMPDSVKQLYHGALSHALRIGKDLLAGGGTSMEAVEKVVNYFETDPRFNAGIGSVYTADGTHEMDAADEMIYKRLQPNDGGLIAVDAKGNYAMPFNSSGMFLRLTSSFLRLTSNVSRFTSPHPPQTSETATM